MTINRNAPRTLQDQLADDLRQRITAGEYAVGEKLPSLRTLAAQHSVSEVTAHDAVRALQREGVLESASGRGTFVRQLPASDHRTESTGGALADLRHEVEDLAARVSALEKRASDKRPG